MGKLIGCVILSVLAILATVQEFHSVNMTIGADYWGAILTGRGRQVRENDGVVTILRFGWCGGPLRIARQEIDASRVHCVREYVDTFFAKEETDKGLPGYRPVLFELLTGYDPARDKMSAREWWKAHREDVSPTQEQVSRFLAERRKLIDAGEKSRQDTSETIDGYDVSKLMSTPELGHAFPLGKQGDQFVQQWHDDRYRNLLIQCVYYPTFIFFVAYAIVSVLKRLRAAKAGLRVIYPIAFMLFTAGVMLPYALGYNPYWFATDTRTTTPLYDFFLFFFGLPGMLCGYPIAIMLNGMLKGLATEHVLVFFGAILGCGIAGWVLGLIGDLTRRDRSGVSGTH